MIEIGKKAPLFSLPSLNNKIISLEQFKGKNVVLYFYPRDNTPGCTNEAKDFSSLYTEFEKNNTVILGVSKDSVKSHENFCQKHNLKITLLSDESGTVIESYGAWGEKENYGKKYMGIIRSTVLIDSQGIIKKIWNNVKVKDHANEVLQSLV